DLVAAAAEDAAELWRTALPDGIDARGARIGGAADPSTGLAVLSGAEGPGVLVDLSEGRVVAEEVEGAAHDPGLDITVVAAVSVWPTPGAPRRAHWWCWTPRRGGWSTPTTPICPDRWGCPRSSPRERPPP